MIKIANLLPSGKKTYSVERLEKLHDDLVVKTRPLHAAEPPPRSSPVLFFRKRDSEHLSPTELRERMVVFRSMAASKAGVHEHFLGHTADTEDKTSSTAALSHARKLEAQVVDLIRMIGEVLVNSEQPSDVYHRSYTGECLEYFCHTQMLAFFVEIVQAHPTVTTKDEIPLLGVTWTAHVKAQVLHSIALLVSSVRETSALYYLLSNHHLNELVTALQPLDQWTDSALDIMLPTYVDLLKNLSLQLASNQTLFPFFTLQKPNGLLFPLFTATLNTITSKAAQSNSYVHSSCLNLLVDLIQVDEPAMQEWLVQAQQEQNTLSQHLCDIIQRRYQRLCNLVTGPVVDHVRSNAMVGQLKGLDDHCSMLNDVLWCGLKPLSVQLCEALLQQVVRVALRDLYPGKSRSLLPCGLADSDVIPKAEGRAQVATLLLASFFQHITYAPLLRMLLVSLFLPRSPKLWFQELEDAAGETSLTKALEKVVRQNADDDDESMENVFCVEIYRALDGSYGEWRLSTTAVLLESVLRSTSLDPMMLELAEFLPLTSAASPTILPVEKALVTFLKKKHYRLSSASVTALECASSLAAYLLYKGITTSSLGTIDRVRDTYLWKALMETRNAFYVETLESQHSMGVAEIFVDLVEACVQSRYTIRRIPMAERSAKPARTFECDLERRYGCVAQSSAELLIRKLRSVSLNDVEATRFNTDMAFHFRGLGRVLDGLLEEQKALARDSSVVPYRLVDDAGPLASIFVGLRQKPLPGTGIDLRGRMTFEFTLETRQVAETLFDPQPVFVVVLDPTDMILVRSSVSDMGNRSSVVCCVPLLNVIAAAGDDQWLHVAVRHDDVGRLIKNGNMALCFDSAGTCLIIQKYLDRCRHVLRSEVLGKIRGLFSVETTAPAEGVDVRTTQTF